MIDITIFTDELTALNAKYCIITDVRQDQDGNFVVCDIYSDENICIVSGACYWYDGINKNIPFNYMPEV